MHDQLARISEQHDNRDPDGQPIGYGLTWRPRAGHACAHGGSDSDVCFGPATTFGTPISLGRRDANHSLCWRRRSLSRL